MRLVLLSDTHGQHDKLQIPDGDVLIHCGDYSATGTEFDLSLFDDWLSDLPHKHKVVISGNHDLYAENMRKDLFRNAVYLLNESVVIDGIKFWGSPFSLPFNDWAFNRSESALGRIWAKIPADTNVLITHSPPYGVLDTSLPDMVNCGSRSLLERVKSLPDLRLHVFGHIHECPGKLVFGVENKTFINCSCVDGDYCLYGSVAVFDL
jgi:Icc-related predicted phosphoesterase